MCRCKIWKILKKVLGIGAALYAVLFAVFFFDLDGKLLFYVVEPFLKNHYDKMPRRDVTKQEYKIGNL